MKKKQQHIPRFNLSEHAKAGIYIQNMEHARLLAENHDLHQPHRDYHHLLLLLKAGEMEAMVDFKNVQVKGPAIAMIFADQVHHVVDYGHPQGYSLTFDTAIMTAPLQKALENPGAPSVRWADDAVLLEQVFQLADLLHTMKSAPPQAFTSQAMQAVLQAILCLLASAATSDATVRSADNRGEQITQEFLRLLHRHFREWKRPGMYAAALAITTSHLNDMVRAATGFSVSHHLQQTLVLEAKRLLSHTDKTVKEITYEVGLEDHGYFSRLFKKVAGQTPLQFRQQFRQ